MGDNLDRLSDSDGVIQSLAKSAEDIDGRMEVLVLGVIASVTDNAGLLALAESKARGFAELVRRVGRYLPSSEGCVVACLAYVAASRKDILAAQEIYPILRSQPGHWCSFCSSDRLQGLLAQTMGNVDLAISHYMNALAFCGNAGYRPEYA